MVITSVKSLLALFTFKELHPEVPPLMILAISFGYELFRAEPACVV
jgi:hypothetical protein